MLTIHSTSTLRPVFTSSLSRGNCIRFRPSSVSLKFQAISTSMKIPNWGLVLGLLLAPADVLAQGVVTATISVDTGSCAPATSTRGLASNGGVGGGVGASGLTGGTGGTSGAGAATETGGNGASASGVPNGNGGNGTGSGTTSNPS